VLWLKPTTKIKAAKKEQVNLLNSRQLRREWLFKTGMENIKNRRERLKASSARVSQAQEVWFLSKSARALEMSGQLEFELDKVQSLLVK
jgi:hypothetical protein